MKKIAQILRDNEDAILKEWMDLQLESIGRRDDMLPASELREQSSEFLRVFSEAARSDLGDVEEDVWSEARSLLREIALSRAQRGFSPTETATFVLSLKEVLFRHLLEAMTKKELLSQLWSTTELVDKLGLYVMDIFIERREDIIERQQEEMLEISTPVVELWDGILALPVIGTLDSSRSQVVMEAMLEAIVRYEATIAIIDITGVPAVDTQTAQHLLKTVQAAELMGAECFVSGIRPQIAQTIVQLGLELDGVQTISNLASALEKALAKRRKKIVSM